MNDISNYLSELIASQFENRKPQPIPENVSAEQVIKIAISGHMEYLILGALIKTENLETKWLEVVKERVLLSISRTISQIVEIKHLQEIFENNEIKNQPMKGARLKFIYPTPEMREMSDIDILIFEDCMDKAEKILLDEGYSLQKDIKHHKIFIKEPCLVIEAHRAMYDKTVDKEQFKYYSDLSRAKLVPGCNYTYDFDWEDFYVYLISHMAKHFYTMGCGIRNLVDIYIYLNVRGDSMDRVYIDYELKKLGLFSFAKQMENLAFAWMKRQNFSEFQQHLFDYMVDGGIYGKDENGIWNRFAEEKMKDAKISEFKLKRWYYFPSLSYMAEDYPWLVKYAFLLPIAWIIRGIGGILQKKGKHKLEMLHEIDREQIRINKKIYQEMQLHFK